MYQYFISHCEFFPMYFKMNLKQSMCNCTVHVQCFQQSALRRSKTQSNGSYLSSSRLGNYFFKQKTKQTDKRKKKQVVSILQKNFPSFWPFCGGLFKPHFTIDKLLSQCLGTNIQVLLGGNDDLGLILAQGGIVVVLESTICRQKKDEEGNALKVRFRLFYSH